MSKHTMSALLELSDSNFVKNNANFLVLSIKVRENAPELIINPKENFEDKLQYIKQTYDENLIMKDNNNIKIIDFDFVESIPKINYLLD